MISEFRFRGPNGGNDEFVEIYNNTDAPIDISGWKMNGSNNAATTSTRATVPAGTILPARRHYLFINSGGWRRIPAASPGNQTLHHRHHRRRWHRAAESRQTRIVDQVGMSAGSAYKEGTPTRESRRIATRTAATSESQVGCNGSGVDTNDNVNDFQLITPSDPENLNSAPTPGIAVSPTSVDFGSVVVGGTSSVNVTITNLSSTASVTLNTPLTLGGTNPA